MGDDEQVIREAWGQLVHLDPAITTARRHDDRTAAFESTIDMVLGRHREPHRRYHTVTHVAWVLRHVDELLAAHPVELPHTVRMAAIFHDVVYDPQSRDNERHSASMAADCTKSLGWSDRETEAVRRLVMATIVHGTVSDDEAIIVDADLSILGTEPATYDEYVAGIRFEYSYVSEPMWRIGRATLLRRFMERGDVYTTPTMRDRCEVRARANMTAELAILEAPRHLT